MRVGLGWDIHRLVSDRRLLLGGVEIDYPLGFEAHSDGDVLLHALMDALLGAAALGDIGKHFPPSEEKYKNISSATLLESTLELIDEYIIENIDCTIIAEAPKMQPYIQKIRLSIASLCKIDISQVSLKATTAERLLGEVGKGEAIIAEAVVLIRRKNELADVESVWI